MEKQEIIGWTKGEQEAFTALMHEMLKATGVMHLNNVIYFLQKVERPFLPPAENTEKTKE